MKFYQIAFAVPFALAFGLAAHALIARGVKLVLWAWAPLASGEPEAVVYERRVYHTADRPMMQVAAAAALAGIPWLVALAGGGLGWGLVGFVAVAAVVTLDVMLWERVAVSAHYLWFQRGFRGKVHQVAMENIRDGSVEETETRGFTLRHGTHNRLVRLLVRLSDKRVIALPKTDAHKCFESVKAVDDYLRMRLRQLRDQESARDRRSLKAQLDIPAAAAPAVPTAEDDALQRELAKLRLLAANKRPSS